MDYKKNAQTLNTRGTSAFLELTPTELHHKRATEILDDKKYKSNYERNIKGRGMMLDMINTPGMDHIKHAEDIKSNVSSFRLWKYIPPASSITFRALYV